VKGFQSIFLNKGPGPLQRGNDNKNVKIGWGLLKIFFRSTGSILNRLEGNEWDCPSPMGGTCNNKRVKIH
jgi:hypothetical protein